MSFFGAVIAALYLLTPAAPPEAGTAPPADGDLIIEISGIATGLEAADLNGDRLKDLVVLLGSDPAAPEGRGMELQVQKANRTFESVKIPTDWVKDAFLVDMGNFSSSPGKEIVVVREHTVGTIAVGKDGKPKMVCTDFPARSLFKSHFHDRFVFLDMSADLDGDGLSDPVLPAPCGYIVLFGKKDGSFREPVEIACPPLRRVVRTENASFAISTESSKARILPQAGKLPLLIMEQAGRIICNRWDRASGRFKRMASPDTTFGSYSTEFKVGSVEYSGTSFGNFLGKRAPALLLSRRAGSPGLLADLKTEHIFHTMAVDEKRNRVILARRQIIANAGICGKPSFSDIDADGHSDLVLTFVKSSAISKLIDEFLDRVVISCQIFLFNPKRNTFSFKPDWSSDFSVPTDAFQTVGARGLLILDSDFSRDRRPDLVVFEGDRLRFLRGFKDSGFFSTKKVAFKSRPFFQVGGPFPGPLFTDDLDGDGQKELITYGKNIVRVIHVL